MNIIQTPSSGGALGAHASSHRPNGSDPQLPLDNLAAVAAPTTGSDSSLGYVAGSKWVHSGVTYWCMDSTAGAAIWVQERTPWTGYKSTREIWSRRMARKDSRYVLPSIEAFKLSLPTAFLSRSRVVSGDVRIISIGNSYANEAWPKSQFERRFAHLNQDGAYLAQQSAISSGNATLTGGAAFAGGANGSSTLCPAQEGHLNMPSGSTVTIDRICRGYQLGYVRESGAGTITVEVSNDGGATWTFYTTSINASGATAYLNQTPPSLWARARYSIRLTASGGAVKIGLFVPTGTLSFHNCVTGASSGGGYIQWSAANLIREATDAWWAGYDPDIVFVRYSDDQALDEEWSRFVSILTTACPNAQIIITGEHSNDSQWLRDVDDGEHVRRNDSLRLACQALPNVSFIDCMNWLPNFQNAHALGSMPYNDPPTNSDPDNIHLSTVGGDIVRALQWEALRPWLFPHTSQPSALNDYRARTIFETSGWEVTNILQSDISTTNDTSVSDGPYTFSIGGLEAQGWYELEMQLRISSTSAVGAKLGFTLSQTGNIITEDNRIGAFWNNSGVYTRLDPPITNNPGVVFPAGSFGASTTDVIYVARMTFQANASSFLLPSRANALFIIPAQENSSGTPMILRAGSLIRVRKPNRIGGGGTYHRDLLPL